MTDNTAVGEMPPHAPNPQIPLAGTQDPAAVLTSAAEGGFHLFEWVTGEGGWQKWFDTDEGIVSLSKRPGDPEPEVTRYDGINYTHEEFLRAVRAELAMDKLRAFFAGRGDMLPTEIDAKFGFVKVTDSGKALGLK